MFCSARRSQDQGTLLCGFVASEVKFSVEKKNGWDFLQTFLQQRKSSKSAECNCKIFLLLISGFFFFLKFTYFWLQAHDYFHAAFFILKICGLWRYDQFVICLKLHKIGLDLVFPCGSLSLI